MFSVSRTLCLLSGILASLWMPIAAAQNGPVIDLTGMSLEDLSQIRLSTASRHLDDPRKAPTAMTVISADEISRYGWRTLADLLRSVTGFYTAYDRTYSYVGVHGFLQSGDYNARTLLLIDGHRINDNIYDGGLIGTEFPLDLSLIDRVEILRGPGGSLYGTNAELAVVNVITRAPGNHAGVELTSDANSFAGRTGELRASLRTGRLAALLSGSLYRSNGQQRLYFPEFDTPENNNGVAVNIDGDRYDHLFGTVRVGNLRVQGVFGKRDKLVPNAAYDTVFNDPRNHTMDTTGYVEATYNRQVLSDVQLDVRAYYDAYRFWASYPGADGTAPTTIVGVGDAAADSVGVEGVAAKPLGRHRVVAGFASERSFRLQQRNYSLGQSPYLDDNRTLFHNAVFGEAEINPLRKLSFNVGGRLDSYNLFGSDFSPRVAVMYFPTANTSVKYIFGQAFRAPDTYDQFYASQDDDTRDHTITPETVTSHTLLYEHAFNPNIRVVAEGFANNLNNAIRESLDAEGDILIANGKGDTNRGADLELIAKYTSGWQARASYTFAESRDQQWGKQLMNSPTHLAKFNGIAPLGSRAYFGSELLFTGAQPNHLEQRIPSSFLVNATVSTRPFAHGFELSASSYNLLDRHWATPTGPEVVSPATVQDGRTLRFRLTWRHSFEGKGARQ